MTKYQRRVRAEIERLAMNRITPTKTIMNAEPFALPNKENTMSDQQTFMCTPETSFRKRPVVIQAFQMTKLARQNNADWPVWLHEAWNKGHDESGALYPSNFPDSDGTDELKINTLEGSFLVSFDDWIIQGVKGELYPCKPDIFSVTYEQVGYTHPPTPDPEQVAKAITDQLSRGGLKVPEGHRIHVKWDGEALPQIETLNCLSALCRKANDKWWRDPVTGKPIDRNKGELLALIHSEVSECLEGVRKDKMDDHLPHRKMEEVELADALIRIFDYAGEYELDLDGALREKLEYNAKRADHSHEARMAEGGKKF